MTKTKADNFLDSFKDDPQSILDWCDREIEEYKKLKKLIKKHLKK